MVDDGAMNSLLAAVAVVAAKTEKSESLTSAPSPILRDTSAPPPTPTVIRNSSPLLSSTVSRPPLPSPSPSSLHTPARRIVPLAPAPSPNHSNILPPLNIPPPPPLPPRLPSPPPVPPSTSLRPSSTTSASSPSAPLTTPRPSASATPRARSTPLSHEQPKKGARIFSQQEKNVLETNYAKNKFPSRVHMNTIARALNKSTDKVRTWYNNRRALDRKMGFDVARNTPATPRSERRTPSTPTASVAAAQTPVSEGLSRMGDADRDDAVILPPNLSRESPAVMKTPRHTERSLTHGQFVGATTTWVPTVSPLTAPTQMKKGFPATPEGSTPASPGMHSSSRFRIPPLRVRHVRLVIGNATIYGEVANDPPLDQGLEVKFLFGKRRIVYEWYCGQDYSQSQDTGGPYAKMEMTFASISKFRVVQGPSTTQIYLSFGSGPLLFLQTDESMNKFKQRAQQRQYRKVGVNEFPITAARDEHVVYMKTEEASRVCNILIEDYPALQKVFETAVDDKFVTARPSPTTLLRMPEFRNVSFNGNRLHSWGEGPLSSRLTRVSLPSGSTLGHGASQSPLIGRSDSGGISSSTTVGQTGRIGSTSERGDGLRRPDRVRQELGWPSPDALSRQRSAAAASGRIGPAGSAGPELDERDGGSTPLTMRLNGHGGGVVEEPGTVRRELHFGNFLAGSPHRNGGTKRRSTELCGTDENGERERLRRRLSDDDDDERGGGSGQGRRERDAADDRVRASQTGREVRRGTDDVGVEIAVGRAMGCEEQGDGSKMEGERERGSGVIRRLPR